MTNLHRCAGAAALAALLAIALTARVDTAPPGQQWPVVRTGAAGRVDTPPAEASGARQPDVASREDLLAAAQRAIIDVRAGRSSRWAIAGDDWIPIGPFGRFNRWNAEPQVLNGPLIDLLTHPTRADTYVAISYYGGVLQTTDAGASWRWINDTMFSSTPATAPHPWVFDPHAPGVVYSYENPGGAAGRLLRSDDGGATFRTIWTTRAPGIPIRALAADPRPLPSGQTRLLLLAAQNPVDITGDGTVAKYSDREYMNANRLQFNPRNPDMVFASGQYFYRSTDGGRSWVNYPLPGSDSFGLAVGGGNPPTLYIARRWYWNMGSGSIVVYRSDNAGESWSTMASLPEDYYIGLGALAADPEDPMTVLVGASVLRKSTDGGRTFAVVGEYTPMDDANYNRAAFDAAGRALAVCDLGILRVDGTRSVSLNRGFSAVGFTRVELDPDRPLTVYGSLDSRDIAAFRGPAGWYTVSEFRDALTMAYEPQQQQLYTVGWSFWFGPLGGVRYSAAAPWQTQASYVLRFTTPDWRYDIPGFRARMLAAPWSPSTLYMLSRWLSRSSDQGAAWTTFPREFQTACRSLPGGPHCEANVPSGFVTAIGFSDISPGTFAVGGSKGHIFWTTTDGSSWTETWLNLPYRQVTDLVLHPRDTQVAWASFGGYNADDPTGKKMPYAPGHVFKTTDRGSTWKDVSGNLPDLPVNTMVVDTDATPATVYVGTDVGVFKLADGEATWQVFGKGLPPVRVSSLALNRKTQTMAAGTLGRGMFLISSRFGR